MGSEKLIQEPQQIEAILSKAKFIHIALSDSETPYIVPMSFGYLDNAIYLHSSREGKKIEILKILPSDQLFIYSCHQTLIGGVNALENSKGISLNF